VVMEAREMVGSFERLDYVVKACFLYERVLYNSIVYDILSCCYIHLTGLLLMISSTHLFARSVLKLPSQLA